MANTMTDSTQSERPPHPAEGSSAKIQGLIAVIALFVGNIAEIVTHLDELRAFILKIFGTEWLYRFHGILIFITLVALLIGYACALHWVWCNFIAKRAKLLRYSFVACSSSIAAASVVGSFFLLRPVDFAPILKRQTHEYIDILISQQTNSGPDSGGFKFSQKGISEDTQAWTTAQCLAAILQGDKDTVSPLKSDIRRGFDYLSRVELDSGGGWGYQKYDKWQVTEIDAWVALAYIYSIRRDKDFIWDANEVAAARAKIRSILDILIARQREDGGWSVIEKTTDPKQERTYSGMMAVWALSEADRNGNVFAENEEKYRSALTSGLKWLLGSRVTSSKTHFRGWWPNPSVKDPDGVSPGLTAQVLFVLSLAKSTQPFVGSQSGFEGELSSFLDFAENGVETDKNQIYGSLEKRDISDNDRATDSDRYIPGRTETAEQSTFLWYPWTVAMATSMSADPLLSDSQRARLKKLLDVLLRRSAAAGEFAKEYEVVYPVAEALFANDVYFNRIEDPSIRQK